MGVFMNIINNMEEFSVSEFNIGDIVRSGLVRSYLINKIKQGVESNGKDVWFYYGS